MYFSSITEGESQSR